MAVAPPPGTAYWVTAKGSAPGAETTTTTFDPDALRVSISGLTIGSCYTLRVFMSIDGAILAGLELPVTVLVPRPALSSFFWNGSSYTVEMTTAPPTGTAYRVKFESYDYGPNVNLTFDLNASVLTGIVRLAGRYVIKVVTTTPDGTEIGPIYVSPDITDSLG